MPRPVWTLEAVNERLKAGRVGVAVKQVGNRLKLVATLPPKPGSGKDAPHQQQISLGIYANPDGLAEAETRARQLGVMLASGGFSLVQGLTGGKLVSQVSLVAPLGVPTDGPIPLWTKYLNSSRLKGLLQLGRELTGSGDGHPGLHRCQ